MVLLLPECRSFLRKNYPDVLVAQTEAAMLALRMDALQESIARLESELEEITSWFLGLTIEAYAAQHATLRLEIEQKRSRHEQVSGAKIAMMAEYAALAAQDAAIHAPAIELVSQVKADHKADVGPFKGLAKSRAKAKADTKVFVRSVIQSVPVKQRHKYNKFERDALRLRRLKDAPTCAEIDRDMIRRGAEYKDRDWEMGDTRRLENRDHQNRKYASGG